MIKSYNNFNQLSATGNKYFLPKAPVGGSKYLNNAYTKNKEKQAIKDKIAVPMTEKALKDIEEEKSFYIDIGMYPLTNNNELKIVNESGHLSINAEIDENNKILYTISKEDCIKYPAQYEAFLSGLNHIGMYPYFSTEEKYIKYGIPNVSYILLRPEDRKYVTAAHPNKISKSNPISLGRIMQMMSSNPTIDFSVNIEERGFNEISDQEATQDSRATINNPELDPTYYNPFKQDNIPQDWSIKRIKVPKSTTKEINKFYVSLGTERSSKDIVKYNDYVRSIKKEFTLGGFLKDFFTHRTDNPDVEINKTLFQVNNDYSLNFNSTINNYGKYEYHIKDSDIDKHKGQYLSFKAGLNNFYGTPVWDSKKEFEFHGDPESPAIIKNIKVNHVRPGPHHDGRIEETVTYSQYYPEDKSIQPVNILKHIQLINYNHNYAVNIERDIESEIYVNTDNNRKKRSIDNIRTENEFNAESAIEYKNTKIIQLISKKTGIKDINSVSDFELNNALQKLEKTDPQSAIELGKLLDPTGEVGFNGKTDFDSPIKEELNDNQKILQNIIKILNSEGYEVNSNQPAAINSALRQIKANKPQVMQKIDNIVNNSVFQNIEFDDVVLDSIPQSDYFIIDAILRSANFTDEQIKSLTAPELENILTNFNIVNPQQAQILNTLLIQNGIYTQAGRNIPTIESTNFYKTLLKYAGSKVKLTAILGSLVLVTAGAAALIIKNKKQKLRADERLLPIANQATQAKEYLEKTPKMPQDFLNFSIENLNEAAIKNNDLARQSKKILEKCQTESQLCQAANYLQEDQSTLDKKLQQLQEEYKGCKDVILSMRKDYYNSIHDALPKKDGTECEECFIKMDIINQVLEAKYGILNYILEKNHQALKSEQNGSSTIVNGYEENITDQVNEQLERLNHCKTMDDIETWGIEEKYRVDWKEYEKGNAIKPIHPGDFNPNIGLPQSKIEKAAQQAVYTASDIAISATASAKKTIKNWAAKISDNATTAASNISNFIQDNSGRGNYRRQVNDADDIELGNMTKESRREGSSSIKKETAPSRNY